MLQNISISIKCCSFDFSIHQRILKNCIIISTKILSSFNINNNEKCFSNQQIRIISERSCDTEDWSNDAENSALHHSNKLHFKIYSKRKRLFLFGIVFHNITVFTIFLF